MSAKYKSPSFLLPNELNTSTNPSLSEDRGSMYSIDFPLTNYIDLGATSNFDFNTSNFSVSLWMKEDSASGSYQPLIDLGGYAQSPYNQGTAIYTNDANKIHIYNRGSSPSNWLTSITTSGSGWNHICVVRSGDNLTVYINNSTGQVSETFTGVSSLNFGGAATSRISGTGSWSGFIDEVCIFNKALTSSNITSLYNSGSPVSSATTINLGAVAYYPLGEQAQMQGYLGNEASSEWQFPNGVLQDYVIDFDGSASSAADFINTSNNSIGNIGSNPHTFSAWINIADHGQVQTILSNKNSNGWKFEVSSGASPDNITFYISGTNLLRATFPSSSYGSWINAVAVINGSSSKIYINGVDQSASVTGTLVPPDSLEPLIIGAQDDGSGTYIRSLNGQMSNVQIFNSALPATGANSVQTLYNNGSPLTDMSGFTSLTNWWKLNADSVYTPSAPSYTTALDFTRSTDDHVEIPNSSSLNIEDSYTISLWANRNDLSQWSYLFDKGNTAGTILNWRILFNNSSYANQVQFQINGTSGAAANVYSGTTPAIGAWTHIVCIKDGSTMRMYINGQNTGNTATAPTGITNTDPAFIGTNHSGVYAAEGKISNVAIYNTALTATQISTLFNFGTPETAISFSPIGWWKLDNTTTGIQDSSGNGNNGTNNGATQVNTSVAVVPSWKIPSALNIPTVNYTSALEFTSSNNEYVDIGNITYLNSAGDFSVSQWVFSSSSMPYTFNGISVKFGNGFIYLANQAGVGLRWEYEFRGSSRQNVTTGVTVPEDRWVHIALTIEGTVSKFYQDGDLKATGTVGTTYSGSSSKIGQHYNSMYAWDGKISNTAFFNSALSPSNINTLYNNGQPEATPSFSPLHWWKLDNTSTGLNDLGSAASNNGTLVQTSAPGAEEVATNVYIGSIPVNGVSTTLPSTALQQSDLQFDSPYSNYSLSFDGTGDYINCGNNVGLSEISSMAFSNWVKYDNPSQANTWRVSMGNCYWNTYGFSTGIARTGIVPSGGVQPFFTLLSSSGTTNKIGGQNSTSNATSLNPLIANTWYHVAGTWDGTTMKLFINGVIHDYKTFSSSWTLDSTTATFFIGSGASGSNSSFPTLGNVDEVALWLNKTLTDAEILQIYNNGKPNDISSLSPTNWWRLGENAYFDNNSFVVPNSISGAPNGTGFGTVTTMISADAPGTYANGIGTNLDIVDRVGDAPLSIANSQSYNIIPDDKVPYVPGYVGDQIANNFSMTFDGVDDYFDGGNDASLQITGNLTISMWFKTTATAGYLISDTPVYGGCYSILIGSNNQIWARRGNGVNAETNVKTSNSYNDGNWHHVAFVSDSTMRIYIDGVLDVQSTVNTPSNIGGFQVLKIGDGFTNFTGEIDEVAIFDTALNAGQIYNDIYQPTATGTNQTADLVNNPNLPTPVAWYRMGD